MAATTMVTYAQELEFFYADTSVEQDYEDCVSFLDATGKPLQSIKSFAPVTCDYYMDKACFKPSDAPPLTLNPQLRTRIQAPTPLPQRIMCVE
ncbi:unnamed protein product [Absidia cylindrospora]